VLRVSLIALALLTLAGCGGSDTRTVTPKTIAAPKPAQTQTQTTETDELTQPTQTTATATAPTAPADARSGAIAKVRALGYVPDDPPQWNETQTLRVLVATRKGSGDGYAKRAFFFVGRRYIGTDTSQDSAGIRVDGQSDTTITLAYALYGPNDALCCPGGKAAVRYHWNGSKLVPLDPIPPASKRG
jgi:hypothetical protein